MTSATSRQQALLMFIHGFQEANDGVSPSYREIARATGIPNPPVVMRELIELEGRGRIHRLPDRARAIEVLHKPAIPRDPQGKPLYFVKAPS